MAANITTVTGNKPPDPMGIYVAMNEALLLGSVRQHRLAEAAEMLNAQLRLEIAERKQAEESLSLSERRFRALVTTTSDAVYRMSPDWSEMRQLDGRNFIAETKNPKGAWLQEYIYPDDQPQVMAAIREAIRSKSSFELEHRVRRADGSLGWTHSRAIPMLDAKGEIIEWFGAATDVTTRRQAAEEIHRLNAKLEERVAQRTAQLQSANEELESFSYSISHDLRAPLRHILGFAELLQMDAGPLLSPKSNLHLKAIFESGKKMGDLIDDLLAFSRIGKTDMHKSVVNLDKLVGEILADNQLDTKGRNIAWKIAPLPPVQGDRALLTQVLVNLISNAVKFTGARAEAKIEIGCVPGGDAETVIFIRDNGAGFNPRYMEKLFGVFQRLHSQSDFPGTGIGLANVRRIIQRHGGRTWAEGKVGEGATFYFSIPKEPVTT